MIGGLRKAVLIILWIIGLVSFSPTGALSEAAPDLHYVPAPQYVVNEMLELAGTGRDDVIYDLGSGDGRFVITAAKVFGARGIGIDFDPERIRESQEKAKIAGVAGRVKFIEANLFDGDIGNATIVSLYPFPELNIRLRPKLLRDLKPGTRILSHDFDMGDWKPDRSGSLGSSLYFMWIVPADVEGLWRVTVPDFGEGILFHIQLDQQYQELEAHTSMEDQDLSASDADLMGSRVRFLTRWKKSGQKTVHMYFKGQLSGGRITGTVEVEGDGPLDGNYRWIALRGR